MGQAGQFDDLVVRIEDILEEHRRHELSSDFDFLALENPPSHHLT